MVLPLLVKANTSSPLWKLPVMDTVALTRVGLALSVTVRPPSTATGVEAVLSPEVKAALPPLGVTTGTTATLTVEAKASVVVSTPPLLVPPLSLTLVSVTTRLPAVGLPLLSR